MKRQKSKDVGVKNKESASLNKSVNDISGDRANVQQELDAVTEYLTKIKNQCVAKGETHEEELSTAFVCAWKADFDGAMPGGLLLQCGVGRSAKEVRDSSAGWAS
jgi:hypothetical protein